MSGKRYLNIFLLLFFIFSLSHANDIGETVVIQGTLNDDVYAIGGMIDIKAQVNGDILALGGEVNIDGETSADMMVLGGEIDISGIVHDDLRVAGGDISIKARITDDASIAGGSLDIPAETQIGGRAWLAGGDINMAASVGEELRIGGGSIRLASHVSGNVEIEGGEIKILSGANIEGDLIYRSDEEIEIHPDAQIQGTIIRKPPRIHEQDTGFFFIFFPLTMMFAGIVLYLLFPGYTSTAAQTVASEPWKSLGIGLAILVTIPFLAIILMATMLGIWVGLLLMVFYFIAVVIALLVAAFFVGDLGARIFKKELDRKAKYIVAFVIAVVLISVVAAIPFVGWLTGFILFLLGLGAGTMQVYRSYSTA